MREDEDSQILNLRIIHPASDASVLNLQRLVILRGVFVAWQVEEVVEASS